MRLRAALVGTFVVLTALAAAPAMAGDSVDVQVEIPRAGVQKVSAAQLRWGLSEEASSGSYAFGCHFLSAGTAGDTGSSRAWTAVDGFYRGSAGDVRIEKPDSAGAKRTATWGTRCLDRYGTAVTASTTSRTTESEVVVDGGTGTVDQRAGDARITWRGSFTVAFYGGLTYWTATDPVLVVADGVGTLTAKASGYGADRDDPSRWLPIAPRTITLARIAHVDLGERGLVEDPDYLGVKVDAGTANPQAAKSAQNAAFWGAFPQTFVDLQVETGQSAYWYTSGGERDRFKVALPVTVSYDAASPVVPPADPDGGGVAPSAPAPTNPVTSPSPTTSAAPGPPRSAVPPASGGTPVAPGVAGPGVAPAVFPATAASTVSAGAPLIPLVQQAAGWLADQDPVLLAGLTGLALLAGFAAAGLWRGWVVVPWTRQ